MGTQIGEWAFSAPRDTSCFSQIEPKYGHLRLSGVRRSIAPDAGGEGREATKRLAHAAAQISARLMSSETASARAPMSSTTDLENAFGSEASSAWKALARVAISWTRARCSLRSLTSPA